MTAARQHADEPGRSNPPRAEECQQDAAAAQHSTNTNARRYFWALSCPASASPSQAVCPCVIFHCAATPVRIPERVDLAVRVSQMHTPRALSSRSCAVPSSPTPTPTLNPAQAFDGSRAARCCVGPFPVGGVHVQLNSTTPRTVSCQSNLVKVTFPQRPPSVVTRTPPRAPGHIANASLLAMPLSTAAVAAPQ